jgi:hypothetical protein
MHLPVRLSTSPTLVLAVVLALIGAFSAAAQIFVTNDVVGTVGEYSTSGATVNSALISGFQSPEGIAFSGSNILVSDFGTGTIGEYTPTGHTVNAALITGLVAPRGIAVMHGFVYVVNSASGNQYIGKYTTAGAIVNDHLISGLNNPIGIAVSADGAYLYIVTLGNNSIAKYTASGELVTDPLVSGLSSPRYIAEHDGTLYVTSIGTGKAGAGTIGAYTNTGGTINASLITGLSGPRGVTLLSGAYVLVANFGAGTIGKYTTNGATVNASLISGLTNPYALIATNGLPSPSPTPSPTATATPVPSKLVNISTRAKVETGDDVLIAGFIIQGETAKKVLIRAIGPSLAQAGVSGPLQDPLLEVHGANQSVIAANDNWRDRQSKEIQDTGVAPLDDRESAVVITVMPGNYTAIVRGKNNTIGAALVEVYELN